MNKFFITTVFLLSSLFVFSIDSTFVKVPKQISLELGYSNIFAQSVNLTNHASNGYGFLFDYGWKVSGLNGKKPAVYLTVPFGYTVYMADDANSKSMHMMNYGWTVRHELSVDKPVTPFVGYALLLNNIRITGTEGSVYGHQTKFEFGANINTKTKLKYYAKVEGTYASFPQFNQEHRFVTWFADFRLGVRF